jgi:hypothetical protein
MTRSLPIHHNLEDFEKQARNLLHNLRRRDAAATQAYFSVDPLAGHSQPSLADAKYVVARQYGFRSWQELKQRVVSAAQQEHREQILLVPRELIAVAAIVILGDPSTRPFSTAEAAVEVEPRAHRFSPASVPVSRRSEPFALRPSNVADNRVGPSAHTG